MKIGLGFLFGGKDDGAKKALVQSRTGLADIDKGAKAATKSAARLNTAIGAFGLRGLNEISDKLSAIAGGEVNQLTSDIQSQAIAFDKSFAASGARAGIFGNELKSLQKEVFSTAYGLNASADAAGETVLALKHAGITTKDLGLANMSELIKFSEVAGLDMHEFAASIGDLKKSYNFGDQTGAFVDDLLKQSTALGLGTTGLSSMTAMMTNMDDAFAKTLAQEGPEAVKATTDSLLKLAGAMHTAIGTDPQKAMDQSIELFKKLQEQANVLPEMMAGMESQFDPMLEKLAVELPGGFTEAFGLMQSDPVKFMSTMETAISFFRKEMASGNKAAEGDLQRLMGVLSELGPDFSFLADSGGRFGQAVADGAKKAGVGMSQFANETYKSGLTLDDVLNRARDGFKTRLFGLTQKDTKEFVKGQQRMYKRLGDSFDLAINGSEKFTKKQQESFGFVEKAALKLNENGFGPVVQKLLYLQRVGPMALAPMFDTLQQVAPIAGALGALGLNFGQMGRAIGFLLGPLKMVGGLLLTVISPVITFLGPEILLIGAAIAAVVGGVYLLAKALDGTLGPTMQGWAEWLESGILSGLGSATEWLTGLTDRISGMDPAGLVDAGVAWLSGAVEGIIASLSGDMTAPAALGPITQAGTKFMEALGKAILAGGTLLYGIGSRIATLVGEKLGEIDWSAEIAKIDMSGIYTGFMAKVTGLFSTNKEAVKAVQSGLRTQLASVDWTALFESMGKKGAEMRGVLIDKIVGILNAVGKELGQIDWEETGKSLSQSLFSSLFSSMGEQRETGGSIGKILSAYFKMAFAQLFTVEFWSDALSLLWAALKLGGRTVMAVQEFSFGLGLGLVKALGNAVIEYGPGLLETALWAVFDTYKFILWDLPKMFQGLVVDAFTEIAKYAVDALFGENTWAKGEETISRAINGWKKLFSALWEEGTEMIRNAVNGWTKLFDALWSGIQLGAELLFGNSIHTMVEEDLNQIGAVIETVKGWFDSLWLAATTFVTGFGDTITSAFTTVYDAVGGIMGKLTSLFYGAWDTIKATLSGVTGILGPAVAKLFGKSEIAVTGDASAANAAKAADSATRAKLLEQADNRSLILTIEREFGSTRLILERIHAALNPQAALPVAGAPAGGAAKTKAGVTP